MKNAEELERENEALRVRLSRLSEASLRINESLDFETVLQGVLDSARSLTGARYGVIVLHDDSGQIQNFLTSGLTPGEIGQFQKMPDGMRFFEYLISISEPLRLRDFHSYTRSLGLPEFLPPMAVSPVLPFMAAPIRHRSERVGAIYIGEREDGFTPEDEETLVMFASQAALVIANARRYQEEQRARNDLETLVNTAPVGVVVFDVKRGTPVSVNQEARRIVGELHPPGETAEQLLDTATIRRADGRAISLYELPLTCVLSIGETLRAEEVVIEAPGGESVSMLVNATPILSEDGVVESLVVTMQDMAPLEELERLRGEFIGMVSHELRTPLTSIRGSADTLMEAAADLDLAEMQQFFRIIREQADHMRELIGDLLDITRIETGTLSVNPEPVEPVRVIDDARTRFLSSGGRDRLRIDIPPDLPMVMADRRRIVQVLANLLVNAARHSDESSTIRVTAVQEDFHVAISVADEGRGISAERLPLLFRKFSRIESEEQGGDTGLGLAICKGIVEAHGGRIWAESDGPGLGARFTFTIPVDGEAGVRELMGSAHLSSPRRRGEGDPLRILVVDDDPQTLWYVRDTLTRAGYEPIVTGNPEEALRLMEESKPHLALLDLMLPGTDGIELMGQIVEIASVPAVFLSAYGQEDIIARAFEMGAADYVVKPFSSTELLARIGAALRRKIVPELVEPKEPFNAGELRINYAERGVTLAGRPVRLTPTEYDLLFELSVHAGRVLTHEYLLARVWGPANSGDTSLVRTIVRRLRQKLGDDPSDSIYIFTQPRVGYRMVKGEEPEPD
ncbi:MAG: response regulator [Dehalococcoidia bacterium]|nr:response regulator [Dehalococcoidia bacterium]